MANKCEQQQAAAPEQKQGPQLPQQREGKGFDHNKTQFAGNTPKR